jgi:hypothetical protein
MGISGNLIYPLRFPPVTRAFDKKRGRPGNGLSGADKLEV